MMTSGNNYWIKLYHEILNDPKMGRLPDNVWRRAIELMLLAGETQQDGRLPSMDDICWQFRHISPEQIETEMEHLKMVGILSQDENGWYVTKFSARQAKISNAEKQRAYRERKRTDEAANGQCEPENSEEAENDSENRENDQPVTEQLPECYQPVTDGNAEVRSKKLETDITITTTARGRLATFYQKQTGYTPRGVTDAEMWEDDCGVILDLAGNDVDRAEQLMSEGMIILDELKYTHKNPGSLIKTISRQLQKKTKQRGNGAKANGHSPKPQPTAKPGSYQPKSWAERRKEKLAAGGA